MVNVDHLTHRCGNASLNIASKLSLRIDHKHLHINRRVGFGFVTFDGSGPVDEIMNRRDHSIKGKEVSSPAAP